MIYLAGNSCIFKAISVSKIYKMYPSSFEIIFKYVSASQKMYSLHVWAHPIFPTTFSLDWVWDATRIYWTIQKQLCENCFFILVWTSPLLNQAIIGHVGWLLLLAMSVPNLADWTLTVTVCIQNIYQPHGHKPQTLIIMQLGRNLAQINVHY